MSERYPEGPLPRRRPPVPPGPPEHPGSSVFDTPTAPSHPRPDPYRPEPTVEYPAPYPEPGPPGPPHPSGPARRAPGDREPYRSPPDRGREQRGGERAPARHGRPDDHRGPGRGRERGSSRGLPFGPGFLVGVLGLGAFLAALLVLPWFSAAGQDVTLSDIRSAFTIPATDPTDLIGESPDQTITTDSIPTPDEVSEAVEQEVRETAAEAAAAAIDNGKARYLELYVDLLWAVVAVAVVAAVVFSTILTPRSAALSLLLGFRRLSGVVTVLAAIVHGVALWIVFSGDGAPDPSFGVWLGLGGLGAVLVATFLGPKR